MTKDLEESASLRLLPLRGGVEVGRKWFPRMAKKVKCPACHNDPDLKKNCLICRGQGEVWMNRKADG
jgi:hypothetical protein